MQDVAREGGRTVLFVSHAMNSVLQLCTRCIYMKNGTIHGDGPAAAIVEQYIREGVSNTSEQVWHLDEAPGDETVKMTAARIVGKDNIATGDLNLADDVILEMQFVVLQRSEMLDAVFHVFDKNNNCVFANGNADDKEWVDRTYEPGSYRVRVTIPGRLLNDGGYVVTPILVRNYQTVIVKLE